MFRGKMKFQKYLFLFFLFVFNILYAYIPEFRFFIIDSQTSSYKVVAIRVDLNEPMFGGSDMMISSTDYDSVDSNIWKSEIKHGAQGYIGFDSIVPYDYRFTYFLIINELTNPKFMVDDILPLFSNEKGQGKVLEKDIYYF